MMHCCKLFAEHANPAPNNRKFEKDADTGDWNVYGCCGGGCFVVQGMKFCPFCGAKLTPDEEVAIEEFDK